MKTMTKGSILAGSAIVLGALGIAAMRWASGAAPSGEAPRAAASKAEARGSARTALVGRRWSPGTTYVYEIEHARAITLHGDHGAGSPDTLGLSGRLAISVVGPAEEGILLRLVLHGEPARLSGAFHAVADPTGRLASFAFPRGLDGAARGVLKGLASALQVVVPDRPAASWRATEQDATGEYEAAYRAAGDAIHKVKERFVRARGARGLTPIEDPSAFRVESSIELGLDASGWPRTASEDETLTVKAGSMRIEARSRTRARLAAIEQTPELARIAAAEQRALEPEPEIDAAGFATAKRRADEGLVGGASYERLLGDLASGDVRLRNRTMARLAALFRIEPELAEQAAESVLRGGLDEETAKRLVGALGGAGTEEAQLALASVLDEEGAPSATRSDAAAALGLTRRPTGDSKRSLLEAAGASDPAVASSATLGLGNLIKRMNDHGAGDPADAVAALTERLRRAADDAERILCLDALGNSGDPRALPAIEPYLTHAEVPVRAAATLALRFLRGADDRVVAALQDAAPGVRRAAAGALAYRAITPMLSLVTLVLQHDADVTTRLELVTALQLRKRHEPALAGLLAWAAEHDPAAEVRRAAGGGGAPPA